MMVRGFQQATLVGLMILALAARISTAGAPKPIGLSGPERVQQALQLLKQDPKKLRDGELKEASRIASEWDSRLSEEINRRKSPPKPLTPAELYRRCASAVVTVRVNREDGEAAASGFLFGIGRVATNFHVAAQADTLAVDLLDGRRIPVEGVDWADRENDLVVLKLRGKFDTPKGGAAHPFVTRELLDSLRPVGTPAYVIGDPKGLTRTLTSGLISGIRETDGLHTMYQISVPASAGSSGYPVFDQFGVLMGVVTSSLREGQNLNFCVPSLYLHPFGAPSGFMPMAQWKEYSRPPEPAQLPTSDADLQQALLKDPEGFESLPLRHMRSVVLQIEELPEALRTLVSREHLWEVVAGELKRRTPWLSISTVRKPGTDLDLSALLAAPTNLVYVRTDAANEGAGIFLSCGLEVQRACLLTDENKRDPHPIDDWIDIPTVWNRSATSYQEATRTPAALDEALTRFTAKLATQLQRANPHR